MVISFFSVLNIPKRTNENHVTCIFKEKKSFTKRVSLIEFGILKILLTSKRFLMKKTCMFLPSTKANY